VASIKAPAPSNIPVRPLRSIIKCFSIGVRF
jgi:hypothetical protein